MSSTAAPENPLALDQQVCFALYSASRAITSAYRPLLAPLGLTYPQYLVMLALWERAPRTVRELGETLHLESGTLSPLLKRMEANGLVRRTRSTDDERRVLVALTAAGTALRERAETVPEQLYAATGIDAETLVALRRACQALIEES
ncbi:DNA-binding MarR family transcriptional regulator [Solirubrobacter pauli]|uniref:DNA-binding MarR family transcriptional regulator n=1 Tax=Solirubrobacter pauli TaxID=166793 RepID=A0A660L5I7_9ACTN|nr:MarR family transcriptional regulator [Solirubrobacter pauli]RKQ88082.1 DNA-binding MarR family transcriptional regulator [Solirubrobacter pauli]